MWGILDAGVILAIVFLNALLDFSRNTERRGPWALSRHAPQARVLEGTERIIPARDGPG